MRTHECLKIVILLLATQYETISLSSLLPWTRQENHVKVNQSLAILKTQIGQVRFGCRITAKALAFDDQGFYEESDFQQCRAGDIESLFQLLNQTNFGGFKPSSCTKKFKESVELFKCLKEKKEFYQIDDTPLQWDLSKFKGAKFIGCKVTVLPWDRNFYDSFNFFVRNNFSTVYSSQWDYIDKIALCAVNDMSFFNKTLVHNIGNVEYDEKCNLVRSVEAMKTIDCVHDSLIRIKKLEGLIEVVRPLCHNKLLWTEGFLKGSTNNDFPKQYLADMEFRHNFFQSAMNSTLYDLLEKYRNQLKDESLKMLGCLLDNHIPDKIYHSISFFPTHSQFRNALHGDRLELTKSFLLIFIVFCLTFIGFILLVHLLRKMVQKARITRERQQTIANLNAMTYEY